MLPENFDFEKIKERFIKELGVEEYLRQFKAQLDTLQCSSKEKFETYYMVRSETLKKYAA